MAFVDFQYDMERIVPEINADRILFRPDPTIDNSCLFANLCGNRMTNETALILEYSHISQKLISLNADESVLKS